MRRTSLVLIILVVFGALTAPAEQRRRERDDRSIVQRLIRTVRSVFRPQATSDGLTPPSPAPQPRP